MNILEQEHENCTDTVYDIVENDCGHQNGASQLFLVVFLARDFNLVLDVQNDKKGGRLTTHKNSLKEVQNIINSLDLIDIWRVSNPDIRGFTWRRSKPEIHCRLDFFLTSNSLSSAIIKADILPGYKTDHSLIMLHLANNTNPRGPGFWKLHTSLI